MLRIPRIAAAGLLVAIATACGSGGGGSSAGSYHPRIKAAEFTARVDNPWFPLKPGTIRIFTGTKDGKAARDVYRVTTDTKVIDGVSTRVVDDELFLAGHLEETTTDYYTQDKTGTVWYFGEDTRELDANGKVVSTKGSWRAGAGGAQPGIFMEAEPAPGHRFRQEYMKGEAQDFFQVVNLTASVTVPYGAFRDTMLTKEWTPLEPGILDHKYYVRGIGQVQEIAVKGPTEELDLIELTMQ
jgi:hypothetical protein